MAARRLLTAKGACSNLYPRRAADRQQLARIAQHGGCRKALPPFDAQRPPDDNAFVVRGDVAVDARAQLAEHDGLALGNRQHREAAGAIERRPEEFMPDDSGIVGKRPIRNPRARDDAVRIERSGKDAQTVTRSALGAAHEAAREWMTR